MSESKPDRRQTDKMRGAGVIRRRGSAGKGQRVQMGPGITGDGYEGV